MATEFRDAEWTINSLSTGWLMTEGCVYCGARRSFISQEKTPPLDSYIEGNHYWRDFEGARTFRFDLVSRRTRTVFKLDSILGLALCMDCDPSCLAGAISKLLKPEKVRTYIALCADPSHASGKCASSEHIIAMIDYLNSRLKGAYRKVLVLPCSYRKEPDCCRGQVVAELGGIGVH